jgi:hypothetical protein
MASTKTMKAAHIHGSPILMFVAGMSRSLSILGLGSDEAMLATLLRQRKIVYFCATVR